MAKQFLTDIELQGGSTVKGVPSPTADDHAVNRAYVDAMIEGLAWKDNVRVASSSNVSISSPGDTIDGVTMEAGDRVLIKSQTEASENGIYIWNGADVVMTRAPDADTFDKLEGAAVSVDEGSSAATTWRQSAVNGDIGTSAITWGTFGTAAPAASTSTPGIARFATQPEVDAGLEANATVTPSTLANWEGKIKRHTQTIGDGSATSYTVTHNFNTRDVIVQTYRNSGSYDEVIVDVERGLNAVTIKFREAPASNSFKVVVVA